MNSESNIINNYDYSQYSSLLCEIFDANGLSEFATDDICTKLTEFCKYLLEQNEKFNLTAIKSPEAAALLHFADSLTLCKHLPGGAKVLDIGSGASFPAIPIAIARPDIHITALDSTQKRINFIQSVAYILDLKNLSAVCARAEDVTGSSLKESFDVATARAVAAYPMLLELSIPAVKVGGKFVAMKSKDVSRETSNIAKILKQIRISEPKFDEITLKGGETFERTIVSVTKLAATPEKYPRAFAQIKKRPLF
jgi:16S rRNA (guanine(527)-N(7))-methyltransferase RsmG